MKKKYTVFDLIPIFISLLSLGITGYFWFNNNVVIDETAEHDVDMSKPPVFFVLKPFTVTLYKKQNNHIINKVLHIGITLRLADEDQKKILSEYLPEVRSQLLLMLTSQDINHINTEVGKLQLVSSVKQLLSRHYTSTSSVSVDDVLLTDFIIR